MRQIFFFFKKLFIRNPRLSIFFICSSSSLTYYYRKNNFFNYFQNYNPQESIIYKINQKNIKINQNEFLENSKAIHVMEFDKNEPALSELTEYESIEINSKTDFRCDSELDFKSDLELDFKNKDSNSVL